MLGIDGDGTVGALTAGLLALRWLFGFRGNLLIGGATGPDCARCTATPIEAYLASIESQLDIDADGEVEALTDGLLVLAVPALSGAAMAQPLRVGPEFQVNSYTDNAQRNPSAAAAASGDFVVVWESLLQDEYLTGVFGQRFSADAAGDFVVVWQSFGQDFSSWGVFARRFSSAREPLAEEFQATTQFTDSQRPIITSAPSARRCRSSALP